MKKIKLVPLLLALCSLFCSFVGCSKDVDEENSTSTTETSTECISENETTNNILTDVNDIIVIYPEQPIGLDNWESEILGYSIEKTDKYTYKLIFTFKLTAKGDEYFPVDWISIYDWYYFDSHGNSIPCNKGGYIQSNHHPEVGDTWTETHIIKCPNLSRIEII